MSGIPMNRTIIGTNAFIDIVGFSRTSVSHQWAMKSALNRAIGRALASVAETDRIVLDTGDGAAIAFLGDPEEALFVANAIRDETLSLAGEEGQKLRIGINLGPIRIVTDVTGRTNVIGDGINVAQRIMSFADENEILVSRSYYEVVARLREGNELMFRGLGVKTDKHVREHQVYALLMPGTDASCPLPERAAPAVPPRRVVTPARVETREAPETEPPAPPPVSVAAAGAGTAPQTPAATGIVLPAGAAEAVTGRLTRLIGPLAPVIVARAVRGATSLEAFVQAVAAPVVDGNDRKAFLAYIAELNLAAPAPPTPGHAGAAGPAEAARPAAPIDQATLERASGALTQLLGPIAPVLVRKAAKEAADAADFHRRLATHLPDQAARAAFLKAVGIGTPAA